MTTILEQYARKPDPSEPWRYVCPRCGGQVHGTATGPNQRGSREYSFRCVPCGETYAIEDLRDRKA